MFPEKHTCSLKPAGGDRGGRRTSTWDQKIWWALPVADYISRANLAGSDPGAQDRVRVGPGCQAGAGCEVLTVLRFYLKPTRTVGHSGGKHVTQVLASIVGHAISLFRFEVRCM